MKRIKKKRRQEKQEEKGAGSVERWKRSLIGRKEGEGFLFRPPAPPSGLSGGYNA